MSSQFGKVPRRNGEEGKLGQDKRREVRPGRRAEEGTGINALQRGELLAHSLQFCASLCGIIDPRTSSAAPSHDCRLAALTGLRLPGSPASKRSWLPVSEVAPAATQVEMAA
jgi:hypothetical protein